jgi:dihydropteroate synthase
MVNARILYIEDIETAKEEIRKIGVDEASYAWLCPKMVHITMKLENITPYAANIIKQEMLGKGGDVAVNKEVAKFNINKSEVLIMGTYSQFNKLIYKLSMQPPSLKEIAEEIQAVLMVLEDGKLQFFKCGTHKLPISDKTFIMGILNVTPDSFSDAGNYQSIESAVKRAKEMVNQGADIIDVGGESTRPGHKEIDAITEINRVIPVVEMLAHELRVPISVDTSKSIVAEKALLAGASIINDIWGLQKDINMAGVISKYDAGLVIMHNQDHKEYLDLMGDIIKFFRKSIEIAEKAGILRDNIAIDPGIGFGKTLEHNLEVMRRLKELRTLNLPVLIGTSRKSIIGNVLDLPLNERLEGTAATITLGIANGVDIVRVHDVKEMVRVARMTDAMVRT